MERWCPVAGWPYEVSDLGRVRRTSAAAATRPGRILKPEVSRGGYLRVRLYEAPRACVPSVHHLVLTAFVGAAPGSVGRGRDDFQANHRDGDKANNTPSNLEWVTTPQNHAHAAEHGLKARGESHGMAILTTAKVRRIRVRLRHGHRHHDIASEAGVSRPTVTAIHNGRIWRHVA